MSHLAPSPCDSPSAASPVQIPDQLPPASSPRSHQDLQELTFRVKHGKTSTGRSHTKSTPDPRPSRIMSASPPPPEAAAQPKKILFRFCQECSNLLYPKEDKETSSLLFSCRTCSYSEPAPSACIMRHEIASTVGDTAGITQDVGQDPTVGVSEPLPEFCTLCGEEIFCNICGQETENGLYLEADDEHFPLANGGTATPSASSSGFPSTPATFNATLPFSPNIQSNTHQEGGQNQNKR